ncbi:Methyltransferase N6AMT1 [Cucumispora dikerogammari]|nr:Methyltransferase N6AMT1 [Cucumispora dikerogammari]
MQTDINFNIPILKDFNYVFTDLLNGIKQDRIDFCFFNPPYVPTRFVSKGFKASYSGGNNGVEVINRFIETVEIKEVVVLVIEVNKPLEIIKKWESRGYSVEIVLRKKIMNEVIYLIRGIKADEIY